MTRTAFVFSLFGIFSEAQDWALVEALTPGHADMFLFSCARICAC